MTRNVNPAQVFAIHQHTVIAEKRADREAKAERPVQVRHSEVKPVKRSR